jgi:catechol 2,3-dioxygenase-like lactoylglutathione lyase family enzyme
VTARSVLGAAIPQLYVADIDRACRWYAEALGFAEVFRQGDPACYAQVARDAARLNLRRVEAPLVAPARVAAEEYLAATILLDDIARFYAGCRATRVTLHRALTGQAWGALDFVVRDADGNLLLFTGPG